MALNAKKTGRVAMIKQRGIALISVMLVVALVSVIAVEMIGRLQIQVKRTLNIENSKQAYWYALGAETFAGALLKRIAKEDKEGMYHLGQDWAYKGMTFPVPGGTISGDIYDMQACFNLNALRQTGGNQNGQSTRQRTLITRQFQELLDLLSIQSDVSNEALADRLYDWLDDDGLMISGQSLEEDDYASLEIPYLAANTMMGSISELRLITGFNPAVIDKLKPYVCVIPESDQLIINVNTIPAEQPELLSAMIEGLDMGAASDVLAGRPEDGFKSIDEFWQLPELQGLQNLTDEVKNKFDVKTNYFKLVAKTTYDDSEFFLTSTLFINSESRVSVIRRKFGGEL